MIAVPETEALPLFIGPYRVLRKLGEGGIGMVFEARHVEIERSAAIKLLKKEYAATPEVIERFFNEARAAGRIDHPGIVQVFDFGRLLCGDAYLVMELLSGESLASRLGKRLLNVPDALRFTWQTAAALAAAHQAGIVHRDIKPENLMLIRDGMVAGGERVKVVDFGIAKLSRVDGTTRTGTVIGTPAYMAPEQCRGMGEIDARVDVYSLGVVLFLLLAGRLPFVADNIHAYLYQHMFEPPPSLCGLVPELPIVLHSLLHRMLAKAPEDRPPMAHVAAELQALLSGTEAVGPRPWTPPPRAELVQKSSKPVEEVRRSGPATTLKQATSDRIKVQSSTRWGWTLVVAMSVGLLGSTLLLRRFILRPAVILAVPSVSDPQATPVPEKPARVSSAEIIIHWSIQSEPPGAEVLRTDGTALGTTPYAESRPASAGTLRVLLRKAGFASAVLTLRQDANQSYTQTLRPLRRRRQVPEEEIIYVD